jgi:hypothetical protein
MGQQLEYRWMGRVRVDKKIFGYPWWYPSPWSIKDRIVLGPMVQALTSTDACMIYGVL